MLERRRDGDAFFQRRLPQGAPGWVPTVRGPEYDMVCPRRPRGVAWMVNLGAVTFHPWPVRRDALGHARSAADRPRPAGGDRVRRGGRGRPQRARRAERARPRGLSEDVGRARPAHRRADRAAPVAEVQATREAIGREVVERAPELATISGSSATAVRACSWTAAPRPSRRRTRSPRAARLGAAPLGRAGHGEARGLRRHRCHAGSPPSATWGSDEPDAGQAGCRDPRPGSGMSPSGTDFARSSSRTATRSRSEAATPSRWRATSPTWWLAFRAQLPEALHPSTARSS